MGAATKPWTADELGRLPDGWRYEIDAGELVIMSPGSFRHSAVLVAVAATLRTFVQGQNRGKVIGGEFGFLVHRNPDTLRGVDVAFYSTARLGQLGDPSGFSDVPPDLAVEVHRSSDADLLRKIQQYLDVGVRSVWVVDPEACTWTRHQAGVDPVTLTDPASMVTDAVLPGFTCPLSAFFE